MNQLNIPTKKEITPKTRPHEEINPNYSNKATKSVPNKKVHKSGNKGIAKVNNLLKTNWIEESFS